VIMVIRTIFVTNAESYSTSATWEGNWETKSGIADP